MTFIQHAGISNKFDYHNFDSKRFNGNIFSTYCANLIKIGPVTPNITSAKSTPFWTKQQKSAFRTKYLSIYGTDRNHNFSAIRKMYADYKSEVNFEIFTRLSSYPSLIYSDINKYSLP